MSTDKTNQANSSMMKTFAFILAGLLGMFGIGLMANFEMSAEQNPQAPQTQQSSPTNTTTSSLEWDEKTAPNYVATTGTADFEPITLETKEGHYQTYADDLGRPTLVVANVNYEMAKKGADRQRDDLPNPLGWPKNAEVDIQMSDGVYHGWLFNRSHLLAKSLGGPDTKDNLVTGTRCQNVGSNDGTGGMGLPETISRDWLRDHQNGSLYYEVEPNYLGDEKIPRTVSVDVRSSDGTIDSHFVTYNAAKGYAIDYATGDWHAE
jgi:DNA-entry nuclease